jgi:RNA polymerase sigma factor (sigma-70 family)
MRVETGPPHSSATRNRDGLICENLALVDAIARNVRRRLPAFFDLDDLVAAGRLGLMHAAERYRPELHAGTPFSAYARFAIRGAILFSVRRGWSSGEGRQALRPLTESLDSIEVPAADRDVDDAIDRARLARTIHSLMNGLSQPARRLLRAVYAADETAPTVRAAAKRLGIPQARAYRLHNGAIAELRRRFGA